MAYAQLLSEPHDPLIEAQARLKANSQEVQAVRQAEPDLVHSPIRGPLQPEVWGEESNAYGDEEPHDDVAAYKQSDQDSQNCRYRKPCANKDVGVGWFPITCQHQASDQLRIGLRRKKASDEGERLGKKVHINGTTPCRYIRGTQRLCHFLQQCSGGRWTRHQQQHQEQESDKQRDTDNDETHAA